MRKILFFCLLIISCCPPYKNIEVVDSKKINIDDLNRSTVVIVKELGEGVNLPVCAGVWIDEKKILTAAHCVSENVDVRYETYKDFLISNNISFENYHSAKVKKINNSFDLALIEIEKNDVDHGYAKLSSDGPKISDNVFIISHPNGNMYSFSKGYVSNFKKVTTENGFIRTTQVTSTLWMGSSGGGAFNKNGELIGVCSMISSYVTGFSYFIELDDILLFLQKNKKIF